MSLDNLNVNNTGGYVSVPLLLSIICLVAILIRSAVLERSSIVITGGIMESPENELLYLKENPKAIFFTDFDGTITLKDCMILFPKAFLGLSLRHDTQTRPSLTAI